MSDEDNEDRKADIRVVRSEDSSYYRVDVVFMGHIKAAIRWDDRQENGRSDVLALMKDAGKVLKDAFLEIDVEKGRSPDLDAEWAYWDESGSIETEEEEDE